MTRKKTAASAAATAVTERPPEGMPLGKTGRTHPPFGLGLWALGRWNSEQEKRTREACARALERGIQWYDTAEVYGSGRSERLLGDALERRGRDAPPTFVTTKLSWEHLHAAQVRASLLGSLQRLGRESVDVYLVHAPDDKVPIGPTMAALEALWKEGKCGAIGVSNFSLEQLEAAEAALSEAPLVVSQVLYNLFDREDGDPLVEHCRKRGIVLEAYTPLARGLLAGRYLGKEKASAEARRYANRLFEPDRFPMILGRAKALSDLAQEEGVPMASLALHWIARRGFAPVVGASQASQVDDLLDAWARRPSDAALDRADAIARG